MNPTDPMCQPVCTAQTSCAAQGKTCGSIDDGCGHSLDCGSCKSGLTCGGGGKANVCGASCDAGCPSGYACSDQGVCTGGTPSGIVIDVKTVKFAGKVTLNGGLPTATCSTASPATVQFQEVNLGYAVAMQVPCTPTFEFSGLLYPGTYKVMVSGTSYSNLPQGSGYIAKTALAVSADQSGVVLDVRTVNVSGKVTLNGGMPAATCGGSSAATVNLQEVTRGYSLTIPVSCGTGFVWSGSVYPGTYKVSVVGSASSNIPTGASYVVDPSMILSETQADLVLDVKTVALSGKVTLNGMVPTSTCTSNSPASVILQETTMGYYFNVAVPCGTMYAWSATVYPGTYKIFVVGNSYSNLPFNSSFLANPALAVSANQTGIALDVKTVAVSGKVTLNGAVPTSTCSTASPASVTFQDMKQGTILTVAVPCNAMFAWTGNIYPGTYKVSVAGNTYSNLPIGTAFVANPALVVSAAQSGVALDVKTVAVDGVVTLNGAPPTTNCVANSPANVLFHDATQGYDFTIPVQCGPTFAWSGSVYPGTYRVIVAGTTYSNLPQGGAYVAKPALTVNAAVSGLTLDATTVPVDGMVTLNGAMPTLTCSTSSPAAVTFTEINLGYSQTIAMPCNPSLPFTGNVYLGTYRIAVAGNSYSNLPALPFVGIERLQIP